MIQLAGMVLDTTGRVREMRQILSGCALTQVSLALALSQSVCLIRRNALSSCRLRAFLGDPLWRHRVEGPLFFPLRHMTSASLT